MSDDEFEGQDEPENEQVETKSKTPKEPGRFKKVGKQLWECVGDTCVAVAHRVGAVSHKASELANPYRERIGQVVGVGQQVFANGPTGIIGGVASIGSAASQKNSDKKKLDAELKYLKEVERSMKELLKTASEGPYQVCSLQALEQAVQILSQRISTDYASESTLGGAFQGAWPEWYRTQIQMDVSLIQSAAVSVLLELNIVQARVTALSTAKDEKTREKLLKELQSRCIAQIPEPA